MDNTADLKDIFERFINNECSEAEIATLLALFDNPGNEQVLREIILAQLERENMPDLSHNTDLNEKQEMILARLQPQLEPVPIKRRTILKLLPRIAAAASVMLVAGIGYYFMETGHKESLIVPGKSIASLTLANGKTIPLDNNRIEKVIKEGDVTIGKTNTGQLVYNMSASKDNSSDTGFNTVTTPAGGQYEVVLPDGTHVWLNASSSIRFPASFSAASRRVELKGEAYFEVAKIGHAKARVPFYVTSAGQEVEVLGTHFDIDSYKDEPFTKTTLLEGSVSVNTALQHKVIKPGEQASLKGVQLSVAAVNAEDEIAWKNGNFQFNDADIKTVMREISRWYNVDVKYIGQTTNETFGGTMSRSKNMNEVLKSLEETGAVKFEIEGRTVKVKQ